MIHPTTRAGTRQGLSLLEVLVAMAIFLFALVGIGRLITFGTDRAMDAEQQSRAAQLCLSKMAEVNAGVVSLSSQADVPFDEDPDWTWTLDAEQGNITGLWTVTVTVSRQRNGLPPMQSSLHQMILDPSLRGSATDVSAASSATDTSGASGGNTGAANSNTSQTGAASAGGVASKTGSTGTKAGSTTSSSGGATKTTTATTTTPSGATSTSSSSKAAGSSTKSTGSKGGS
jgi:prepilin-type N-terminal cleavage/methylation domain-containing protein